MKNLIFLNLAFFVYCTSATAWQISTGDFNEWERSLVIKPSVSSELNNFFQLKIPQSSIAINYSEQLPKFMKKKIFAEALAAMGPLDNPSTSCNQFSKVQFPGHITTQTDPQSAHAAKAFEAEMIRVETLDCLSNRELENVFAVFMSSDFQKKSIKGLKSITANEATNQICQQTSVFGLGNSSYCFTQDIWKNSDTIVLHSFNESNAPGVAAPVYFREVITVFKRTLQNEVLVYNLTYGRGPDLPLHSLIKGMVQKQQARLIELLIESSGP